MDTTALTLIASEAWNFLYAHLGGATLTAATSAGALFFSYRADLHLRGHDRPIVEIDVKDASGLAGWICLTMIVRNQTRVAWELVSVEVRPHRAAKIVSDTGTYPDEGMISGRVHERAEANAITGPLRLGYKVQPEGSAKSFYSNGDTLHCDVFLSLRRSKSSISIRVILRSMEAKPRSVTIDSTRSTAELRNARVSPV